MYIQGFTHPDQYLQASLQAVRGRSTLSPVSAAMRADQPLENARHQGGWSDEEEEEEEKEESERELAFLRDMDDSIVPWEGHAGGCPPIVTERCLDTLRAGLGGSGSWMSDGTLSPLFMATTGVGGGYPVVSSPSLPPTVAGGSLRMLWNSSPPPPPSTTRTATPTSTMEVNTMTASVPQFLNHHHDGQQQGLLGER